MQQAKWKDASSRMGPLYRQAIGEGPFCIAERLRRGTVKFLAMAGI